MSHRWVRALVYSFLAIATVEVAAYSTLIYAIGWHAVVTGACGILAGSN